MDEPDLNIFIYNRKPTSHVPQSGKLRRQASRDSRKLSKITAHHPPPTRMTRLLTRWPIRIAVTRFQNKKHKALSIDTSRTRLSYQLLVFTMFLRPKNSLPRALVPPIDESRWASLEQTMIRIENLEFFQILSQWLRCQIFRTS